MNVETDWSKLEQPASTGAANVAQRVKRMGGSTAGHNSRAGEPPIQERPFDDVASSKGGGVQNVQTSPEEDRRSHMRKTGAIKSAKRKFCGTEKPQDISDLAPFCAASASASVMPDLFGDTAENHSEKSGKAGEILEIPCANCGELFSQVLRQGRPLRFCSEPCRQAAKAEQSRAWALAHPRNTPADPITCRTCRREFEPPTRASGRSPHWCSHRCKLASLRKPADRSSMPDMFSPTERKSP